ncbi:hypothetical protein VIGAN_06224800 [Vigna angularis var. angularis]|uniref:Uncharacterized protein n=1 Tax=Vigna angularis var. angularis TaxID=157739 RepID=A0A0S3SDP5_PHAAN|nr:hypothetical protein VIGAN_06224800 [Vigna angularis var. angularis]
MISFLLKKELHQAVECNIRIFVPQKLLPYLRRSDIDHPKQVLNLNKKWVLRDPKVIGSQHFEPIWGAVSHVNVHIHTPRAQESRVQFLLMIRGEHYDPLIPTTRPQPIYEIQEPR